MLQGRFERSRSGRVRGQKCCEAAGWGAPAEPPVPAESRDGGGQSEAEPRLLALAQCREELGFFNQFGEKRALMKTNLKKGESFRAAPRSSPAPWDIPVLRARCQLLPLGAAICVSPASCRC